ncbi:MAG: hypothetical protein P1V36_12325 [Planctomycetota bacterium]|nr:hypothetical protein [Planctomycetota bacterium]
MSSKTFEIPVADDASTEAILGRARDAARGAGIALTGDDASGRFEGTATGSYTVDLEARIIRVEVTDKPGFVPWGMIETALRKVFQ